MEVNKQEEIEKFNNWIMEMDDKLEPLLAYAEDKGYNLDYSLDSLAIFEEFIKLETSILIITILSLVRDISKQW
jgi:hypothetical protein